MLIAVMDVRFSYFRPEADGNAVNRDARLTERGQASPQHDELAAYRRIAAPLSRRKLAIVLKSGAISRSPVRPDRDRSAS